ncbi:hypothetical protein ACF08N_24955 [Streptomyces sp. NPDC015127]|uniref:hypothetical protein n=1 Tax=Streptomyces sp. NPDC015127 TaxID=3364939 RepID=UPI0037036B2F
MHILITSNRAETIQSWRKIFPPCDEIEFRESYPKSLQADAICMSGIYALERYGGSPRNDVAQILDNLRNDGLPPLVVVPPSRPLQRTAAGTLEVVPEFSAESPAYYATSRAFEAIERWNSRKGPSRIDELIFDLPLLGMDDPADRSTPRSVLRGMAGSLGLDLNG